MSKVKVLIIKTTGHPLNLYGSKIDLIKVL